MSYETAPSTILLATHCVACNRPLRDAESVECGMGPDCRSKNGYEEPQRDPSWDRISSLAEKLPEEALAALRARWGQAREVANLLVHRAACAPRPERTPYVLLLEALGYEVLALRLAEAAGEVVEIRRRENLFAVKTPFNADFVAALKAARIGARWDREQKVWTVPADARAREGLWGVVRHYYRGAMLASDKGITTI